MKKHLNTADAVTLLNNLMHELESPVMIVDGRLVTELPEDDAVLTFYARLGKQLLAIEGIGRGGEYDLHFLVLSQLSEAKEEEALLKVRALA